MAIVDGNTGQQQPIVFRWNKNRQALSPVMNPSNPDLYLISPYKLTRDFDLSYEDRDKAIATRPGLDIKRGGDISLKTEYSKKPKWLPLTYTAAGITPPVDNNGMRVDGGNPIEAGAGQVDSS